MLIENKTTMLDSYLKSLSEDQRDAFEQALRQKRLGILAEFLGKSQESLQDELAMELELPVLEEFELAVKSETFIPLRLIHEYQCLPIVPPDGAEEGETEIHLVTVWPPDPVMNQWVFATCGRHPRWYWGAPDRVSETITQEYGVGSGSLDDSDLEGFAEEAQDTGEEDEDAAIIRFVNEVISKAMADRATDIHFEPQRDAMQIRYRIDGELVPVRVPENLVHFQKAIISRLKIMARLNISERRRPQDGRINFRVGKEDLDIRISSLPTMFGESISLRLLSNKTQPVTVEELGFLTRDVQVIDQILTRPHGIILATGPTGSGKSTTLSAFIRKIRDPRRRIITIEDPVEYEISGVNQVQVHHEIGLTFASTLRSVLRQDPDVIMVGEIRDRDTADIAIRASLTGHLVLSTLHTNDAPGAVTRLVDMEIEPFLIASSVEMVIAQRLVRRLCPHCAKSAELDVAYLSSCLVALHVDPAEVVNAHLAKEAVGCEQCRGLGYRGRVGLFEILRVNEALHELIIKRASSREIREVAEAHGMRTLQASGWEQVQRGGTSLDEIMKYADLIAADEGEGTAELPLT